MRGGGVSLTSEKISHDTTRNMRTEITRGQMQLTLQIQWLIKT